FELFARQVKRQRFSMPVQPFQEIEIENMNRRVAGAEQQLSTFVAFGGHLLRQIAVFDHGASAVKQYKVADFVLGVKLRRHFRRHFCAGANMLAKEERVGDFHQRVIDLEIENVTYTALPQDVEEPGVLQRG